MQNRITLIAALILISCAFAFGTDMVVNNGYDPGAMRKNASNADSPVFPGPVTVSGVLTASDSAVIGTSTAQAGYDLTVASGAYLMGPVVASGLLTANAGASVTAIVALPGSKNAPSYAVLGPTLYNSGMYSTNADGRQTLNLCQGANDILIGYGGYVHFPTNIGANTTMAWSISKNSSTSIAPSYSFGGSTNSGLGLFATGEPCMTASGTAAMRWTTSGTIALVPLLVATDTPATGYALTVGGTASDSIYCGGDVNALSFTDRSAAPADLAEAYAIVQSHEAKDGKVDHSKLHAAAWGRKFRVVETGKTIVKTREIAPAKEGGEPATEEYSEPEKVVVSEPDQQGRNLSMTISALTLMNKDLLRRIEALEAAQK